MILVFGREILTVDTVLGILISGKIIFKLQNPQLEKTDPSHNFRVHVDQILNLFIPVIQYSDALTNEY
jgi:hypothetical protein